VWTQNTAGVIKILLSTHIDYFERHIMAACTINGFTMKKLHPNHSPFHHYELNDIQNLLLQTFGIPSIQEEDGIFFLKQLAHARGIRNNIVDSFEKAAVPTVSEAERRRLLSFIVVGGGPTSCEFTSELHGKKDN
jgi:hypothetical protein